MAYGLKVVRFGLYPTTEPVGYAVGFEATAENGVVAYRDTVVSLADAEGLEAEAIANLAWVVVGPAIVLIMEAEETKYPLLGRAWTPSSTAHDVVAAEVAALKNPVPPIKGKING
jgi:hypothetical protein